VPSLSSTRIIALTGYGAERARKSVREAGFDLHLVKPVDAEELEAALLKKEAGDPMSRAR
jgi:CheY-like chemotaxis protein